jgi:hypothetical protein
MMQLYSVLFLLSGKIRKTPIEASVGFKSEPFDYYVEQPDLQRKNGLLPYSFNLRSCCEFVRRQLAIIAIPFLLDSDVV